MALSPFVVLCLHICALQGRSDEVHGALLEDEGALLRRQTLQPARKGKIISKQASRRAITIGDEDDDPEPSKDDDAQGRAQALIKAVSDLLVDDSSKVVPKAQAPTRDKPASVTVEDLLQAPAQTDPPKQKPRDFTNPDANSKGCQCPLTTIPTPLSKLDALKILDSCTPEELMRKSGSDSRGASESGITALGNAVADFGGRLLNAGTRFASWNFPSQWTPADAKKAYEKMQLVLRQELALKTSTCEDVKVEECKCPDKLNLPDAKIDALKMLDACTQADLVVMAGSTASGADSAGISSFGNAVANFGGKFVGPGSGFAAWNYPGTWSSSEAKEAYNNLKTVLRADLGIVSSTCGQDRTWKAINITKWSGVNGKDSPVPKAKPVGMGEVTQVNSDGSTVWRLKQSELLKAEVLATPKPSSSIVPDARGQMMHGDEVSMQLKLPTLNAACIQNETAYYPLNMAGNNRTWAVNHMACRDRCAKVSGCSHWTYYLVSEGCHLQDSDSKPVPVKGTVSSHANCTDPAFDTKHSYGNANPLVRVMGQDCYHLSVGFVPLDMDLVNGTRESDYERCQARCKSTPSCATFVYFIVDQGCHLQDVNASDHMVFVPGTISGKASCTTQEKMHFEQFLENLPPGQIKTAKFSTQLACEDSASPFVPVDLNTSDLLKSGDLSQESLVTCSSLKNMRSDQQTLCAASQQVMRRCPKMCQICDLVATDDGTCADVTKDAPPIFWLSNEALPCSALAYACSHDREIDLKCRKTCGWCNFKLQTTTTTTEQTTTTEREEETNDDRLKQAVSCSRRRQMGFCYTRRRRIM
mmetsp:Transcript_20111/g.35671  ORF Transcript_20111/g.35671 Transcript_20111/m.35671 type:complete len:814 (+) Transcript_20111:100-2541(+)